MTSPLDYPDATAASAGVAPGAGYGDALTTLVDVTAGGPSVLDGGLPDAMPRVVLGGDSLRDSLATGSGSALAGDFGGLVTGSVPAGTVPPPVPPVAVPVPRPAAAPQVQPRPAAGRPAEPRRYGAPRPAQPAGRPGSVSRTQAGGYGRSDRLPAPGTGWLPGEGPGNLRQFARSLRGIPAAPGSPGWQPGGVRWTEPSQPPRVPTGIATPGSQRRGTQLPPPARPPQRPVAFDPAATRQELLRAAREARGQARQSRGGRKRAPVWLIVVGVFIAINIARGCANSTRTDDIPLPAPTAPVVVHDTPAPTGILAR
jgi:hypothetical protein